MLRSRVSSFSLGVLVRVVEPVDVLHVVVRSLTKAHWLDEEVCKLLVLLVHHQVLCLDRHELWCQPGAEQLTVKALDLPIVVVLVCILKLHHSNVRFDSGEIEELLIDFMVCVDVRTTQVIALTYGLLHFQAVQDGKSHIIDKNRLACRVHAFNLPQHPVEHLHLHSPLSSNGKIRVEDVEDVGRSEDGNIWEDLLDLLLSNPLGSKSSAVRVGVCSSSRKVNESLDLLAILGCLSNSHRHLDVGLFKVAVFLRPNVAADARDDYI